MLTRVATARGLAAYRQTVVSLTGDGVYGEALRSAGVPLHALNMGSSVYLSFLRLVGIIRRERPDIIMTWLYHADFLGTLATALTRTPCLIWNLRCSDMDLTQYKPTTRRVLSLLVRLSGRPWAVTSNSAAGQAVHAALGYRPRRWVVLPNGFDLTTWHPDAADRAAVRTAWGLAPKDQAIGLVARVDPMKDHATFLAAAEDVAARLPAARFVLIGRGTERLSLPAALAARTHALGERDDVPRLMRGLDLAVLSSAFGEGFPNAVGEAMATGLPCVVTNVGDAARIVGDTGTVVPPREPARLAAAIVDMLAEGPEALQVRGADANRRIRERWALPMVLDAYDRLWREALDDAALVPGRIPGPREVV